MTFKEYVFKELEYYINNASNDVREACTSEDKYWYSLTENALISLKEDLEKYEEY